MMTEKRVEDRRPAHNASFLLALAVLSKSDPLLVNSLFYDVLVITSEAHASKTGRN